MPGSDGLEFLYHRERRALVFFTASVEAANWLCRPPPAPTVSFEGCGARILVQSLRRVACGHRLPLPSSDQAVPREREQKDVAIAEKCDIGADGPASPRFMALVSEGFVEQGKLGAG